MLDFTRLMLISTQVEVVIEVGVELGKKVVSNLIQTLLTLCDMMFQTNNSAQGGHRGHKCRDLFNIQGCQN